MEVYSISFFESRFRAREATFSTTEKIDGKSSPVVKDCCQLKLAKDGTNILRGQCLDRPHKAVVAVHHSTMIEFQR